MRPSAQNEKGRLGIESNGGWRARFRTRKGLVFTGFIGTKREGEGIKMDAQSSKQPVELLKRKSASPNRAPYIKALPWLFQHKELIHALEQARILDKESMGNAINHIHFTDGYMLVQLRHAKYDAVVLLEAVPEPCLGKELICRWRDEGSLGLRLENYRFLHLVMSDGQSVIFVPAHLKVMDQRMIKVHVPEQGYAVGERQARRYSCREAAVELVQNGLLAKGFLLDFSPMGFRVRACAGPGCSFHRFNSEETVSVSITLDRQIIFSGPCECIRQEGKYEEREIVLKPKSDGIKRGKGSSVRNPRQELKPSPTLVFDHPLVKKRVRMEVTNISTSGFSVYEEAREGLLMEGMIIPSVEIDFAGALSMKCTARVIYGLEDGEGGIRYGLAILDMDVKSYSRLCHIITNAMDPHAYISMEVDMDALWEFLFDTGFIYPKKYGLLQSHREEFKRTYQTLYQESPEIASHFTYQKNGRIYGHISMVRAYEKAWMIHHHAARAMDAKRAGFLVLRQIMHYLNDMYRLPSANLDYVMCYFRPQNKFPDRVFGSFARELGQAKGCSMDFFAYLPHTSLSLATRLPEGWSMETCLADDLWEFSRFYDDQSGGLFIDAVALGRTWEGPDSLEQTYGRSGFLRKWEAYSLKCEGEPRAILMADQSELGLNLSELLNGIKIFVMNPEDLPWHILSTAISQLTGVYKMDKVPILFYPLQYVKAKGIPYEKLYQLWILSVRYAREYLEYMHRKFRIGR